MLTTEKRNFIAINIQKVAEQYVLRKNYIVLVVTEEDYDLSDKVTRRYLSCYTDITKAITIILTYVYIIHYHDDIFEFWDGFEEEEYETRDDYVFDYLNCVVADFLIHGIVGLSPDYICIHIHDMNEIENLKNRCISENISEHNNLITRRGFNLNDMFESLNNKFKKSAEKYKLIGVLHTMKDGKLVPID